MPNLQKTHADDKRTTVAQISKITGYIIKNPAMGLYVALDHTVEGESYKVATRMRDAVRFVSLSDAHGVIHSIGRGNNEELSARSWLIINTQTRVRSKHPRRQLITNLQIASAAYYVALAAYAPMVSDLRAARTVEDYYAARFALNDARAAYRDAHLAVHGNLRGLLYEVGE